MLYFSLSMISYFLCKIGSFTMIELLITNGLFRRTFQYSSSAIDDDFSSPFMEQCTLDAIGVLIISPTAGGGGLGRLRCKSPESKSKSPSPTRRSRVGLGDL